MTRVPRPRHARAAARALLALLGPAALLACTSFNPAPAPSSPKRDAVSEAFHAYRRAVERRNGAGAVQRVSRATLDFFGEMKRKALYAPEEVVREEGLLRRLWIVTLRHRLPTERLQAVSEEELFGELVDRGWVDSGIVEDSLGFIEVHGRTAVADREGPRERGPERYVFVEEGGRWRIDLIGTLPHAEEELQQLAEQQGLSGDELVLALVQSASGVEVPQSIWTPPLDGAYLEDTPVTEAPNPL